MSDTTLPLSRLTEAHPGLRERLDADPALAATVDAVTAVSRSLTRRLETDAAAIAVLERLDRRPPPPAAGDGDGDAGALVTWKAHEFLRIAARDLVGLDPLETTGRLLAELAADVFAVACGLANADALAVVGMGKLGGSELNYASDVDVVFVGDGNHDEAERVTRAVVDIARRCFRVDLNLRPEGRDGPLVRSLESYEAYWDRWAQPWEFQALLKARPVAGDGAVGDRFCTAAAGRLWSRPFDAESLRSVRAMKERAEAEVARRGLTEREIKLGRGGIRDVEFAVQLLQLVHGPLDPALRLRATVPTLAELADGGYVDRHDADRLAAAYRFLRRAEHRLQLADEQQVHAVPADGRGREWLARAMGYRPTATASAVQQFDDDLREHQSAVRRIHERVYFRPLLEAFSASAGSTGVMTEEATAARLAAFGFADADRTRQAVAELTRGLTRSSRLMQQMLPLVLDWLSEAPDPDVGLLGLRNLASGAQRSMELAVAFRDSPEVARRLCVVLGTSQKIGRLIERNPDLIGALAGPDESRVRTKAAYEAGATHAIGWRAEPDERRAALKRYTDREGLRVMCQDVLGLVEERTVGRALTDLAESALDVALATHPPAVPLAVIAVGRFGGGELSYASDLDVLFAYRGDTAADFAEAERVATTVLRFIGGAVPHVYDVDPDLRPEGRDGPLARSLEGFRSYFERYAEPWERLAMVRARSAAGDTSLGAELLDVLAPFVWGDLSSDERREIRRIKARVERERIPPGEDAMFHLKLGRGSLSDVEFTAQLLQVEHGIAEPSTIAALDALRDGGALEADDHAVLVESYRFCERARNRWFLVNSAPGDSLPQQPEKLERLARSLGTSAAELREEYRRVTRRARRVVERLFYGRES